jgi:hypothetical protein
MVTYVNEALANLTEQHNMTTALYDPVAEIIAHVYEELELLHALDEPKSMPNLQQELHYPQLNYRKSCVVWRRKTQSREPLIATSVFRRRSDGRIGRLPS